MKSFVLATLERRSGLSIRLKYPNGLTVIGDMHFNSSLARHELELSEADFLKHSKAICMLARLQGCAVYVAEIKDDETAAHERERAPEVDEFEAGYNLAMDGRELPDEASEAAKMGWLCVKNKGSDIEVIVPREYTPAENFQLGYRLGMEGKPLLEFEGTASVQQGYQHALAEKKRGSPSPTVVPQGNGGHPRGSEESVNLAIHEAAMGSPSPVAPSKQATKYPPIVVVPFSEVVDMVLDVKKEVFENTVAKAISELNPPKSIPEITAKSAFFAIKSAAKREGVDISGCKTNEERAKAINDARVARASVSTPAPSAFAQL